MAKYVEIGGELELVDLELVAVEIDAGRGVFETIKIEEARFSMQDQINTRIGMSVELIRYIRVVSLLLDESEPAIKRGMISYGKTYLYKNLYENVKLMRACEILLIVENRFVRETMMSGIPSPVQFNNRENSSIRMSSNIYGSLLFIADEMHLNRMYAVDLAIWAAFKKLFEENTSVYNTLKDDKRFIDNLKIYDRLEEDIRDLCCEYEKMMP